jgi:ThiF family
MTAMGTRTIAQFGLGALGGPMALELARSGSGNLRVLDGDFVDPATASRWPLGVSAAGTPKALVIRGLIAANWPWTRVEPEIRHLGRVRDPDQDAEGDETVLQRMLDGADVVLDATAEFGVSFVLATMARERSLPYVSVSSTHGGWGGVVLCLRPTARYCWSCYQAAVTDGTIPLPPSDPNGSMQPEGCAAPTFTGTSFELLPVVAEGVRTVVSVLSEPDSSYPRLAWDVAVLALRDGNGAAIVPTWRVFTLDVHRDCLASHD